MRKILLFVLSIICISATTLPAPHTHSGKLVLTFEDIQTYSGTIEVALFNSKKSFLKKGKAMHKKRIPVRDGQVEIHFENLPYGNYAVTSYHDIDDNNTFDRNFLGIPKEPVAVSRMYKKKMRKPRFKEAHFHINQAYHTEKLKFVKY